MIVKKILNKNSKYHFERSDHKIIGRRCAPQNLNDYPHHSVKDELRCTCDISLQIGLVLRLYIVVASRSRVSNIRPNGRADGHKVHPYSNPALLELLGE